MITASRLHMALFILQCPGSQLVLIRAAFSGCSATRPVSISPSKSMCNTRPKPLKVAQRATTFHTFGVSVEMVHPTPAVSCCAKPSSCASQSHARSPKIAVLSMEPDFCAVLQELIGASSIQVSMLLRPSVSVERSFFRGSLSNCKELP